MKYRFKGLLQNNKGWIENAAITVDNSGTITSIDTNSFDKDTENINGYVIPGFQNAHSHAFQYAMAGLAEKHAVGSNPDDFWSWREAMYQLALSISPDQLEAIATMLYSEMVRHGYTNVAEFHYVHHDASGKKYENIAEMGTRLVAAAKNAGINITLIPIFYQKGGFGKAPNDRQRRFISPTIEDYLKLLDASEKACQYYDGANIGIGIHSMRGVEPTDIAEIAKFGPQNIPFHIHISEQLKEIEDSIAYLEKRPVEWMLENIAMNDRFHLVHATHLTEQETIGIAKSKANVVICPTTEGNLGDGIFPLRNFQKAGGNWSIGTDSHIGINPLEELRLLDYGQRLISHKRNTFQSSNQGDSGLYAIEMATVAGRKAMNNFTSEFFQIGSKFNGCIIDADAPLISCSSLENLTSTIVYATDANLQYGTIVNGNLTKKSESNKPIHQRFIKTINDLKNR